MGTNGRQGLRVWLAGVVLVVLMLGSAPVALAPEVGKPAPDFSLPASNGETMTLRQFRGKIVLLEFFGAAFAPT